MGGSRFASFVAPLACLAAGALHAQAGGPGTPWRGAGAQPCFGIDDAAIQCAAPGAVVAIRAGHLFDSRTGQLLGGHTVLLRGDRIVSVAASPAVNLPSDARVIDLGNAT